MNVMSSLGNAQPSCHSIPSCFDKAGRGEGGWNIAFLRQVVTAEHGKSEGWQRHV